MSEEEKPIFEVKPNVLLNIVVTFLKLSIPALLISGVLYYFKTLNIITNDSVLKFFIVAIVFIFTFLTLFLILFEQNKKLRFFKGGVEDSDLFESKDIPKTEIKEIKYKKGIITSFVLEKKNSKSKIVINFVDVNKDFDKLKNQFFNENKKAKMPPKKKPKSKKWSFFQIKRKKRINEIVSGRVKVKVKNPKNKDGYIDVSEKKKDNFVDVKNLKLKTDKDFVEVGISNKKRKNIFQYLKTMKEKPKSLFKRVKELKK